MKHLVALLLALSAQPSWSQHGAKQSEALADSIPQYPPACLGRMLEHHADQNEGSFWAWVVGMNESTKPKICDTYLQKTAPDLGQAVELVKTSEGLQFSRSSLATSSFDCAEKREPPYTSLDKRNAAFSYLFSMKRLEAYDRRVRDEWLALQRLKGPAKPPAAGNPAFSGNTKRQQSQMSCAPQNDLRESIEQTVSQALDLWGRLWHRRYAIESKIGGQTTGECLMILERAERIGDTREVVNLCRELQGIDENIRTLKDHVPFAESGPVAKLFRQIQGREYPVGSNSSQNPNLRFGYDTPQAAKAREEYDRLYIHDKGTLDATVSNAVGKAIDLDQSKLQKVMGQLGEATDCLQGVQGASSAGCVKSKVSPLLSSAPQLSLDELIGPLPDATFSRDTRYQSLTARSEFGSAQCRAEIEGIRKTSKQIGFDVATTVASLGIGAAAKGAMMAGQFAVRTAAAANAAKNLGLAARMATAVPRIMNARGVITTAALANFGVDATVAADICLDPQQPGLEELPDAQEDKCGTSNLLPMQLATQGYLQCAISSAAGVLAGTVAAGTLRQAIKPTPPLPAKQAYAAAGGRRGHEAGRVRLANRNKGTPLAPDTMHELGPSLRSHVAQAFLGMNEARLNQIPNFEEAIQEAHLVGLKELGRDGVRQAGWSVDTTGALRSNYTPVQIAKKRAILENLKTTGGQRALRDDEIDLLLDRGVVGFNLGRLLGIKAPLKVTPLPNHLKAELSGWTERFRSVGAYAGSDVRLEALSQMSAELRAALLPPGTSSSNISQVLAAHGLPVTDTFDTPLVELVSGEFARLRGVDSAVHLDQELKTHLAKGPLPEVRAAHAARLFDRGKVIPKLVGNDDAMFALQIDKVGSKRVLRVPTPEGYTSYLIKGQEGDDLILEVPYGKLNRTQFSVDPKIVEQNRAAAGAIEGQFVYGGRFRFVDQNHRLEALHGGNRDPTVLVEVKIKAPKGQVPKALNPFDLIEFDARYKILDRLGQTTGAMTRQQVLERFLPNIAQDFDDIATRGMQPIPEVPFFQFENRLLLDTIPNEY
jgi:hypothetical protein